ncbi:MAG: T9SS type A sorting domain-containing protein, partial [Bacteroidota bacterium]
DSNSNGVADWRDPTTPGFVDTNSDGIDDRYDSDFDGVPNHLDIDADNDGLADAVEANGGTVPANFDNATGQFTGPVGANGMPDNSETAVDNGTTILALTNSDADALPDYLDIDADNDGIVDNIEVQTTAGYVAPSGTDADGNGRDDAYDGAGALTPTNTDGTTVPDYLDLDSDDDGVPDLIEGHDANADGVADTTPSGNDADGDGLDDAFDTLPVSAAGNPLGTNAPLQNTDGTDDRDWRDTDDDNDGILTANEDFNTNNNWSDDFTQGGPSPDYLQVPDNDNDGIPNTVDIDDDNDGIPDQTELGGLDPDADSNANGIPDFQDPTTPGFVDTNSDGIDDRYDSDFDGVPNHYDIDADNDGLADAVEANGGATPANFDNATGQFTGPVGVNGMPDNAETAVDNGITILALTNSDTDALPDYLDIDADNDGIVDNVEIQTTVGYVAPSGTDADGNGRDDAYDGANALTPTNTDGATVPDYLDLDSDDDGVPDTIEGHDANMDGVADTAPSGNDADGDGLDDAYDNVVLGGAGVNATGSNAPLQNTDGADDRDWRDTDDDNDGILTVNEDFNMNNDWSDDFTQGGGTMPDYLFSPDFDNDGIPDVVDIDDDNDGIPDIIELGGLDPDQDSNSNGVADFRDPTTPGFVDLNSDGIDDRYDSDRDGIPNHYDIDADNDGLADAVEANGGTPPANYDNTTGQFTGAVGVNGMPDNAETAVDNGITILPLTNSDTDALPDYLDIDADNDGIVDNIEIQPTIGYVAPSGTDADGNGRDDAYDGANAITPEDTDTDLTPDYLDQDTDNDGVPDFIEGHDANWDGFPDNVFSGVDTDGDGLDDAYDNVVLGGAGVNVTGSNAPLQDTDLDALVSGDRDWRDTDDDNDGIPTGNGTPGSGEDFNLNGNWADDFTQGGTGIPDYLFNFNLFPVELTRFDAEVQGQDGVLKWITETEINSDYFRVMRSLDGDNFTEIDVVDAAGNSNLTLEYGLVDPNITELGVPVIWYKLEQIDLNGASETYGPIALTIAAGTPEVSVYPNPATNQATLDIRYFPEEAADVYIINGLGQMVMNLKFDIDAPIVKQALPLDQISQGVYSVVVVTRSGDRHAVKLRVTR